MHYLIDGHNLIAHLPDIRLSDPDDEEQLVRRLRRWIAAGRKRRVTLFFDGGLPGGQAPHLSSGSLKVIFASIGREADALITKRIAKVRNPVEYTLVTSDRAIVASATVRGMPVMTSPAFASMLQEEIKKRGAGPTASVKEEPALNSKDVAEWLDIFGANDDEKAD